MWSCRSARSRDPLFRGLQRVVHLDLIAETSLEISLPTTMSERCIDLSRTMPM
ncbi:MAG: hypothetical protein ACLUEQ_04720 [Cloacibacillus evryensis]